MAVADSSNSEPLDLSLSMVVTMIVVKDVVIFLPDAQASVQAVFVKADMKESVDICDFLVAEVLSFLTGIIVEESKIKVATEVPAVDGTDIFMLRVEEPSN